MYFKGMLASVYTHATTVIKINRFSSPQKVLMGSFRYLQYPQPWPQTTTHLLFVRLDFSCYSFECFSKK